MPKIIFNGQEYDNPEDMPPDVRQLYQMANAMFADQDQDGVPDIFESATGTASTTMHQATQFIVDGKAYASLDDLPPDARQKYEQAMSRLDANRDGMPDVFAGGFGGAASPPAVAPVATPPDQTPHVQVIGDGWPMISAKWLLIGALIVLVIVAGFLLVAR